MNHLLIIKLKQEGSGRVTTCDVLVKSEAHAEAVFGSFQPTVGWFKVGYFYISKNLMDELSIFQGAKR